jgi:hypothetical protein
MRKNRLRREWEGDFRVHAFGGGGGKTQNVTQKTVVELTPEQKRLIGLATPLAETVARRGVQDTPFSRVAPQTGLQTEGQNRLVQTARGFGQDVLPGVQSALKSQLNAPDLQNNPYLAAAIDAAIRPIREQHTQTVLPSITSGAVASGGLGGSRQGIAEGLAGQSFLRQVADTSSSFANQAFQKGLEAQSRGLALAPSVSQLGLLPGQIISGVGAEQQAQAQRTLDEATRRFTTDQLMPLFLAQEIAGLASGLPGSGMSGFSQQPGPPGTNPILGALGGAALGGGLGAAINPATATAAGGGAVGAGIGALIGLLSLF